MRIDYKLVEPAEIPHNKNKSKSNIFLPIKKKKDFLSRFEGPFNKKKKLSNNSFVI